MRVRAVPPKLLSALAVAGLAFPAILRAATPPPRPNWIPQQEAKFDIFQGERLLGTESFRIYLAGDTLITASSVRLDGADAGSSLPLEKRLTYLRRALDSYPMVFQVSETPRDTTRTENALSCVLRDTSAVISRERDGRGVVESIRVPPGRVYLLEPGIYLTVQLLLSDFTAGTQQKRKQPVIIPSMLAVVDLELTRLGTETIVAGGKRVETTKVEMTDKLTPFLAWVDYEGKLLRLEAAAQGLRIERRAEAPKPAKAKKAPASSGTH